MAIRKWASAATLVSVPLLALTGIGVYVATAQETQTTAPGGGLAIDKLPPEAEPFVHWILQSAAQCEGLSPAVLAAQLWTESAFTVDAVSHAGAQGPAQFMPTTWPSYGRDDDGNGEASPFDIGDAVMAQGRYMCSLLSRAANSGFGEDPVALALAGYNAGWGRVEQAGGVPAIPETQEYVEKVLDKAKEWERNEVIASAASGAGGDAVQRAYDYLGTPYSWGGGGPDGPSYGWCDGVNGYSDSGECLAAVTEGFDCSSLTQMAWWPTVRLPRVAADQYNATSGNPVDRGDLRPGDLLFWADSSGYIYHVALYYDAGQILHAPRTGENIEIAPIDDAMPHADYYGATRPS